MSATFPNLYTIAKWLDGECYISNFRPVEVKEYIKLGKSIVDASGNKLRDLSID